MRKREWGERKDSLISFLRVQSVTAVYIKRNYRINASGKLSGYDIKEEESDLRVMTRGVFIHPAEQQLSRVRALIKRDLQKYPEIAESLLPVNEPPGVSGPVSRMITASRSAGVGPMAAVAGVVAEEVGKFLLEYSPEVIVENGGDIYIRSENEITVAVFAGSSPLSMKFGIRVKAPDGAGVCTSSATVGHSFSGGASDAVVCAGDTPPLADAVATSAANRIHSKDDIASVLEKTVKINGIHGALAIVKESLGACGNIEIVEL